MSERFTQADVDANNAKRLPKVAQPEDAYDGPERDLHDKIEAELKRRRWLYFTGSMAHKSRRTPGEPDYEIYGSKGRHWLVEAKTKDGKLSQDQLIVKMLAEMNGHEIHTVWSYEEFLSVIGPS